MPFTMLAIDLPYTVTHISDELKERIDEQLRVYWERDGQGYGRLTYDSLISFTTKRHGFLTGGYKALSMRSCNPLSHLTLFLTKSIARELFWTAARQIAGVGILTNSNRTPFCCTAM